MRLVVRRLAVMLSALAAVLTAACTSDDPPVAGRTPAPTVSAGPPPPAPPPPAAPERGACYRLSYADALAPTAGKPRVPCKRPHTSQTYAVAQLDTVAQGHLLAVDSEAVRRQVARRCPRALAPYLGATVAQLRLSVLRPVWFTPTVEQSDAGAGWFRCDVIAVTGDDALASLRGDLQGALSRPEGRDAYGMCGTSGPGTPGFARVLCRDEHSWRAIATVDLAAESDRGRYPGEDAVRAAGQSPCEDAGRSVAADALDFEWGYEWPSRDQWASGQTFGRCWAPD